MFSKEKTDFTPKQGKNKMREKVFVVQTLLDIKRIAFFFRWHTPAHVLSFIASFQTYFIYPLPVSFTLKLDAASRKGKEWFLIIQAELFFNLFINNFSFILSVIPHWRM